MKSNNGIKIFLDGIEQTVYYGSIGTYDGMRNGTAPLNIGSVNLNAEFKNVKLFNRKLSQLEVSAYSFSTVNYADIGATNVSLSGSILTIGKRYRILAAGGSFANVGATNNNVGTEFIATGTTPTIAANVLQIGCVLNLSNASFNSVKWGDINGNNHYADLTNCLVVNEGFTKNTSLQYTGITGNSTFIIPKNYYIESIYIKNTTANVITGGIKIGTSSGGTQVISALAITGSYNDITEDSSVILKKFFSDTADTTLYIQAVTSWNSANINVNITLRRAV
jgi:hypothetical protein